MESGMETVAVDHEFVRRLDAAPRSTDRLDLWWLGQCGFLVQWNDQRLLIDPYLSDSLTSKYAHTQRPHVRNSPRVVDPALLGGITLVTASHFHSDALDALTLAPVVTRNPALTFVGPRAIQEQIIDRLGRPADVLMSDGERVDLDGDITITCVLSVHDSSDTHHDPNRDHQGNALFLGYLIRLGPFNVYHAGDTTNYVGLDSNILAASDTIDLAMLPINSSNAGTFVSMDADAAAVLASRIRCELVVPCHYGVFEHTVASPEVFASRCRELGASARCLQLGEQLTLTKPFK